MHLLKYKNILLSVDKNHKFYQIFLAKDLLSTLSTITCNEDLQLSLTIKDQIRNFETNKMKLFVLLGVLVAAVVAEYTSYEG